MLYPLVVIGLIAGVATFSGAVDLSKTNCAGLPHLKPISAGERRSKYQNRSINGRRAKAPKLKSPLASITVVAVIAIRTRRIDGTGDKPAVLRLSALTARFITGLSLAMRCLRQLEWIQRF
jgi:hypothetical protein